MRLARILMQRADGASGGGALPPSGDGGDGGDDGSDSSGADAGSEEIITMTRREWNSRQAELRRGIERKLENKYAKRASGGSGSGGGSESPTSLADAVNALVQVQLAQALGNMSQPKALGNARPMSDAGAPASPPTASEDTPLWRLKQEDRDHLIRRHGLTWYRETLQKQMRGVRIKVR